MIDLLFIIGMFLCFLSIWILKNSRTYSDDDDELVPILKIWHVVVLTISALIPVLNAIVGVTVTILIGIAYILFELKMKKPSNKLLSILNKRIP